MFDEIKENFINNFLNKNYLWTCSVNRTSIINDMNDRSPFPLKAIGNECKVIHVYLGNDIILAFDLKWESREISGGVNKPIYSYRLINIS